MKEYKILNLCLKTLKESEIDSIQKLMIESLLVGMKMLLLDDIHCQDQSAMDLRLHNFEELLVRVKETCAPGNSTEGLRGLVAHVRKMHSAMAQCLDVA